MTHYPWWFYATLFPVSTAIALLACSTGRMTPILAVLLGAIVAITWILIYESFFRNDVATKEDEGR